MITIYHLGVSQSDRIVWLMEELDLPYQLEWFNRGEDGLAPPEYLALHPAATAPVIRDGDLILCESAAIVEYISQRYGEGKLSIASDQPNFPDYLYWMQFNNNALSSFFVKLTVEQSEGNQGGQIQTAISRRENSYYKYLNDHLATSKYLAGDEFSCADIMALFNLTTLPMFGGRPLDGLPNVQSYVERVTQRPAYIRAMEVAGPQASKPSA